MTLEFQPATLITDLQGTTVTSEERQWLTSPKLGGLILFSRNFESKQQLKALVEDVNRINPKLLITVDHEGGRVQRFRDGFTEVPAMGRIGGLATDDLQLAKRCAQAAGFVLAYELLEVGIHLTYAPVLDVNYGHNQVIGERGFADKPELVTELAGSLIDGLNQLDFAAVAKHFPGHGWVNGDSHLVSPVDERSFEEIEQKDMQPFVSLKNKIDWVMPAHIVYKNVHEDPAGYSKFWLQEILRKQLAFTGPIVSDDLSMEGAAVRGSYGERAKAALSAGCSILLACNSASASEELLSWLNDQAVPELDLSQYQPTVKYSDHKTEYEQALATLKSSGLID